jgi:hypothetical protein
MIISPRESAPLQELKIKVPTDARSNLSAIYVTGRFDILRPNEIEERGLNRGNNGANDMSTYSFAALDDIMELRIMEKGSRPRVKTKVVVNKQTGMGVVRLRKPRRIHLPGK